MTYYVHEGRIRNKAVIHTADCSYCNDGRGLKSDRNPDNHKWTGPYTNLDEAWQVATATGRRDVRECAKCLTGKVLRGAQL